MDWNATVRRRWLGVGFLLGALLMLVAGQTILREQLRDFGFVVYWLACFGLTGLAVAVALLDARENRRRLRDQRRELLQSTLKDIQAAARERRRGNGESPENQ